MFLASHSLTGEAGAVKEIKLGRRNAEALTENIESEIAMLRMVQESPHATPHIVRLLDVVRVRAPAAQPCIDGLGSCFGALPPLGSHISSRRRPRSSLSSSSATLATCRTG